MGCYFSLRIKNEIKRRKSKALFQNKKLGEKMKGKVLKLSEKNFNSIKDLNDKDFGTLVKAVCTYAFYNKVERPNNKVLQVYYDNFKEKIDRQNYFREKGKIGAIKSVETREKTKENCSLILDIFKVASLDELAKMVMKVPIPNCKDACKKEG